MARFRAHALRSGRGLFCWGDMATASPALSLQALVTPMCCLQGGCLVRIMHHVDLTAPHGAFSLRHNDAKAEITPRLQPGAVPNQDEIINGIRQVIEQLHEQEQVDQGYARRLSVWILELWAAGAAAEL